MSTKKLQRKRCRIDAPPPRDEQPAAFQGLPGGSRILASLPLPLSLRQRPRAFLVRLPDGPLLWRLRLPDGEGALQWRSFDSRVLERWAWSSGFSALAVRLAGIRESAEEPAKRTTPRPVP